MQALDPCQSVSCSTVEHPGSPSHCSTVEHLMKHLLHEPPATRQPPTGRNHGPTLPARLGSFCSIMSSYCLSNIYIGTTRSEENISAIRRIQRGWWHSMHSNFGIDGSNTRLASKSPLPCRGFLFASMGGMMGSRAAFANHAIRISSPISSGSDVASVAPPAFTNSLSHLYQPTQVSSSRRDRDTKVPAVLAVCKCAPLVDHQPQRLDLSLVQPQLPEASPRGLCPRGPPPPPRGSGPGSSPLGRRRSRRRSCPTPRRRTLPARVRASAAASLRQPFVCRPSPR